MTHQELIEDFFSHSTERFWEIAMLDDKNYVIPHDRVCEYVRNLIKIPYDKFLYYLRLNPPENPIESGDITQCSSFVACEREICTILLQHNNPGFSYDEIGRLLKQKNGSEKDDAYKKYGENQIKTAKQLGLAFEYFGDWYLSILGYVYKSLSPEEQHALLARTLLRDNLYAHIMSDIVSSDVELLSYMDCISSESTKARRYGCVEFLVRICIEECDREGVRISRIAPRRKFQKKNAEWIASHYDHYAPIAVPYNENLPINIARRAHIRIPEGENARERYFALISSIPPLKFNEEKELIIAGLNGNKAALDAVVEANLPIIYNLACQYNSIFPKVDIQDLIGEGVLALYNSLSTYNPTYETRVLTYAINGIKQGMLSCAHECSSMIHLPISLQLLADKCEKVQMDLMQEIERCPSLEEIAERMDIPVDRVSDLLSVSVEYLGINKEVYFDETNTQPDYLMVWNSLRTEVLRAFATLTPRDADILRKFFGIGTTEKTLEEIGDQLHLTRERVRQIANKAIDKLASSNRSHILMTYLGCDLPSQGEIDLLEKEHNEGVVGQEECRFYLKPTEEENLSDLRNILQGLERWSIQENSTGLKEEKWRDIWARLYYLYTHIRRPQCNTPKFILDELQKRISDLRVKFKLDSIPQGVAEISRKDATAAKIEKSEAKGEANDESQENISENPAECVLQQYMQQFQLLKRSNRNGELAPHKIILLLAILALYKEPKQQKTAIIKKTTNLRRLFNQYWEWYVKSPIWKKDIDMPWLHMKSEPFWHIIDDGSRVCSIDKELKELFEDYHFRNELRKILVEQLKKNIED